MNLVLRCGLIIQRETLNLRIVPPSPTRSLLLVLAGKILVFFLFNIKYVLPVLYFFVTYIPYTHLHAVIFSKILVRWYIAVL